MAIWRMMWIGHRPPGWLVAWLAAFAAIHDAGTAADVKPLRVLASFYPMYVHALNVAWDIDGVVVENLTEPITGCLHDFQLTTGHMRRLADADVLVINGGGTETFLKKVIQQRPGLKVIDAGKGIEFIRGTHHGGGGDHSDEEANVHVWVSPRLAIRQVGNIGDGLAAIDPGRAESYRANARAYISRLEVLRDRMAREFGWVRGKKVITFHEAFPYFADDLGLEVVAVIQRDPGTEPSPRELGRTIDLVRKMGVTAVFAEPQYPASGAEAIRRETGVRVGLLDPVVTGPETPEEARSAYLGAMEKNLRVLRETLQ